MALPEAQFLRSSSKEITTEELKGKKPLTKGISFHETVKVKEIPSVSKSISESSEETSEESSESIEIAPPKKIQPKVELKRTPTQMLMGQATQIWIILRGFFSQEIE